MTSSPEGRYYVEFHRGLRSESSDKIRAGVRAALSTAIPAGNGVPPDMVLVPKSLLDRFPEINPSNYDASDAVALNNWGTEVVLSGRAMLSTASTSGKG